MHERVRVQDQKETPSGTLSCAIVPGAEPNVLRGPYQADPGEFLFYHFRTVVLACVIPDNDFYGCLGAFPLQALKAMAQVILGVPTADGDAKV